MAEEKRDLSLYVLVIELDSEKGAWDQPIRSNNYAM